MKRKQDGEEKKLKKWSLGSQRKNGGGSGPLCPVALRGQARGEENRSTGLSR